MGYWQKSEFFSRLLQNGYVKIKTRYAIVGRSNESFFVISSVFVFFLFVNDSSRIDSSRFCSKYSTRTTYRRYLTELESSRKSLASRTHFEVPGVGLKCQALGLEAYKFLKMPCPQPRTALFFESLKMGHGHDFFYVILKNAKKFVKTFFFWTTSEILRKIFVSYAITFFLENTCALSYA